MSACGFQSGPRPASIAAMRPAKPSARAKAPAPGAPAAGGADGELEALRAQVAELQAKLARAEQLADTDVLAPVLNRRAFVREIERAIAGVARYGVAASLIYFDLDGFKAVNDRYGHAAGDAVLTAAAERLLTRVRRSDIVGRMGGDEFAVILGQADTRRAAAKAAELAHAIAAEPVSFEGVVMKVTASWGVCEIARDGSAESTLAKADAAMFLRKKPDRRVKT